MSERHATGERSTAAARFVRPEGACQQWLARIWGELLDVENVGALDNFYELGGASVSAQKLLERISSDLGVELSKADLDAAPTVRALATGLDRGDFPALAKSIVTLQSGTGPLPLFFLPGIRGHVFGLLDLARAMGPDYSIYGLQPRGLDGKSPCRKTIQEIATDLMEAARAVAPRGPYFLLGYSAGGIVAFEMAQQYHAAGEKVAFLAMLDAPAPGHSPQSRRILWHVKRLFQQSPRAALAYGSQRLANLIRRVRRARRSLPLSGTPPQVGSPLWRIERSQICFFKAMNQYTPHPVDASVKLFTAESGFKMDDPTLGWQGLVRDGVEVIQIPGDHVQMMKPPGVAVLAREIQSRLTQALDTANPT